MGSKEPPTLIFDTRIGKGLNEIWRTTSPQEAPPVRVFISRDGKSVVLLDQWHSAGRGISLAIINSRGNVLSRYTPQQVLPEQDLHLSLLSISSIHWTRGGILFYRAAKPQFAFITARRTVRVFDLATGQIVPLTRSARRAVLDEAVPESRALLRAKDPEIRAQGASRVALLQDLESVPMLRRLVNDTYHYTMTFGQYYDVPDGRYENYLVQDAAGYALVRILGDEAVPLIEAKLRGANPYMRRQFLESVKQCSGPRSRALLGRLEKDRMRMYRPRKPQGTGRTRREVEH